MATGNHVALGIFTTAQNASQTIQSLMLEDISPEAKAEVKSTYKAVKAAVEGARIQVGIVAIAAVLKALTGDLAMDMMKHLASGWDCDDHVDAKSPAESTPAE